MERVWALSVSEFFLGGDEFLRFFFFRAVWAIQEMVLSGMSHLGDAVEADGHSISGIHRTHYMDPWPWVFYFFVFLFIFRLVGFSWRFDVVVFPCLFHITDLNISTEPSGDLRQVLWGETHCLQVPRTAKKLLSIPVSGCEKLREKRFCISQQGAEQNRDMNCWCWKPYKNRKVLMEKILWAPVHRVQIPMHELPTLLYSNHRCLTIGFNVQVMSALMPIVLLKVRKPPKNKQIMDVKVSSGKKNIVAGGRICLLLKEFSPVYIYIYIYLEKSPAEMMSGKTHRHLCLIPGDNFRLVRRSWASAPAF